jgi:hypothetical protein
VQALADWLDMFVAHGVDIDMTAPGRPHETLLHEVLVNVAFGYLPLSWLDVLRAHGASSRVRSPEGRTLLHSLVRHLLRNHESDKAQHFVPVIHWLTAWDGEWLLTQTTHQGHTVQDMVHTAQHDARGVDIHVPAHGPVLIQRRIRPGAPYMPDRDLAILGKIIDDAVLRVNMTACLNAESEGRRARI